MTGKWRWVVSLIVLWQFARATVRAFSVPWRWNADQLLIVFLAACFAVALGVWASIWLRGGKAAVKEHWAKVQRQNAMPVNKSGFQWSLLFWIVVAFVLVVIFHATQR